MFEPHPMDPADVRVFEQGGPFGEDAADYARERISGLARYTRKPILFATVRLIRRVDPLAVVAKASIDVGGRGSFAQARGFSVREAVDRLVDKLRREIAEQSRIRRTTWHRSPEG